MICAGALTLLKGTIEEEIRTTAKKVQSVCEVSEISTDQGVDVVSRQVAVAGQKCEHLDVALGELNDGWMPVA
jgi:hypothetical protein